MDNQNPIVHQTYDFALQIVKLCNDLKAKEAPDFLIEQLLNKGTGIGLKISDLDVTAETKLVESKVNDSLMEIGGTEYCLRLLRDSDYLNVATANLLIEECDSMTVTLKSTIDIIKRFKGEL